MDDSATDSPPASGTSLAVALGRGDEPGLLAAYEAYGPDLFGYAQFLLAGHADADRADEAAAAVLDALLAAAGAVGDLVDPGRMLPWLLALTRNECLRRGGSAAAEDEAAELGRRGLGPFEVAALLGFAPAVLPRRVPPEQAPPEWLRGELVAAAGAEAAPFRAELTRRARPFEPDGFPIPLDRRRLSGKVLAWSAAVVVVIAAGLLVALPTSGNAGSSAAAPAAPVKAVAPSPAAAPAAAADEPVPTLGEAPFGSAGEASASVDPTVGAETDAGPRSPAPATAAGPAPAPQARTDAPGRRSRTSASVEVSFTQTSCGASWSAHLHATTGGVEVSRVTAVARTGGVVAMHRDGDGWSGDLTGLPTNRSITVSVVTDGPVRPGSVRLRADC